MHRMRSRGAMWKGLAVRRIRSVFRHRHLLHFFINFAKHSQVSHSNPLVFRTGDGGDLPYTEADAKKINWDLPGFWFRPLF